MNTLQRWPLFTLAGTIGAALTSPGREVIHNALMSGEQLSRNIAQPIFYGAVVTLLVLGVIEWWIRRWRARRERA